MRKLVTKLIRIVFAPVSRGYGAFLSLFFEAKPFYDPAKTPRPINWINQFTYWVLSRVFAAIMVVDKEQMQVRPAKPS